jgi:hypothetical protein
MYRKVLFDSELWKCYLIYSMRWVDAIFVSSKCLKLRQSKYSCMVLGRRGKVIAAHGLTQREVILMGDTGDRSNKAAGL